VQFVEANVLGVRAVHYRFRSPSKSLEVHLFPMILIGSVEYYDDVRVRLAACDVILFEGVRSFTGRVITLSYRWVTRRKRLKLVTQDVLKLGTSGAALVHADLPGAEFESAWAAVPWYWRVAAMVCAPLYGSWLFFTATRESIGRALGTESLETREDALSFEHAAEIESAILTRRDARLLRAVAALVEQPGSYKIAAVVYGARHMSVVTRLLIDRYHYRVVDSEWMSVFEYEG
jgi:hypothetical protein